MNIFLVKLILMIISFMIMIGIFFSNAYISSMYDSNLERDKLLKIKKYLNIYKIFILLNIITVLFFLIYMIIINSQGMILYCGLCSLSCSASCYGIISSMRKIDQLLYSLDLRTNLSSIMINFT